ncbi:MULTISPECIES: Mur ligase family protein [Thermus]|uniref:UDP-N-acetylmuramoylalanine--D-glutamate ligase n=1 Tax=Thermus brockianus TaxID=56956 RepID=A0A1J0LX19_THEBO|nr:Mur ligase family protein [Thermus brockianus]APD10155.1 UDP-N-acetylmuramoylalanine--D-glutamiate ligase [Thermus brockianus]BDG16520.1 UDP-N-acetylmuramoylalanine--D-glutamate ligase [Thermus brockianus]
MILVFGLGRSGLGVLRFLRARGLAARFYDDHPKEPDVRTALALGFAPDFGLEGRYTQVVAAPGVPLDHPHLKRLREEGAEVLGEVELAYRLSKTPILGVTGTAGKTSTTLFTAHLLRGQGIRALEGGNVDPPLVSVVDEAEVAVAELSSFQLERVSTFRPRVAVLLNLGVDHLDRHGSLEAYHAAKLNLLKNLTPEDALVYNAQDAKVRQAAEKSPARLYPFQPAEDPRESNLRAALAATQAYLDLLGRPLDEEALRESLRTLPHAPHRFQTFARKGKVVFIDDSIATRTPAVAAALRAAPAPIAWILGGEDKGADLAPLRPLLSRVRVILALGRDGPRMAEALGGGAEVVVIGEKDGYKAMRQAVAEALARLEQGSVLLAPLAASFDQFKDYKDRAQAFREAVFDLGGEPWTPSSS